MLHVFGVDGARLGERGGRQGVVRGAVDLAGQSAGGLEQRLDGGRLEQGQFAADEAQPMGEVVVQLVAAEAADVVADDEALAERLVNGQGQPPGAVSSATSADSRRGRPRSVRGRGCSASKPPRR